MTASIEDLQRRVEVLEAGARAERVDRTVIHEQLNALHGGQDAILAILRDHGRMHAEHTAQFDRIDSRFEQIDSQFQQVDARFQQVDARFEQVDARFDRLESKVDNLETKVDGISGQLGLVVDWIQNQP